MSEICNVCGLPKELCVCETIAKETQKIMVKLVKKKFGKKYTLIEGINKNEINTKEIAKKLKAKFACGGTAKADYIELQGDHLREIRQVLKSLGFSEQTIEVKGL